MQSIPLAVLKLHLPKSAVMRQLLHAIHTACGIETLEQHANKNGACKLHAIHTACGIETKSSSVGVVFLTDCMQSIPLAVLKPVRTSILVLEWNIACNPYRLRY